MKIKRILLPIATISLPIALVCPLLTSCAVASVRWTSNDGAYFPSTAPKQGKVKEADLTKTYLEDVNQKGIIFAEDMMWNYTHYIFANNVPLEQCEITFNAFNFKEHRVSFTINSQSVAILNESQTSVLIIQKIYKNIPIRITKERFIKTAWEKEEDMWKDGNWSLFYSSSFTGELDTTMYLNSKTTDEIEKEIARVELFYLYCTSYYFSKIIIE